MKIGIAGPITTDSLKEYLDLKSDKIPKGLGGISVTHLVKGLLEKGFQVSVYSLDSTINQSMILEGKHLKIYFGPFRQQHRMRDLMKVERNWITQFIKSDQPDIVNAHWSYEYALGGIASQKPTLVTFRDWAPRIFSLRRDAYRFGRLVMNKLTLKRGQNFSVNSIYLKANLEKYLNSTVNITPNSLPDGEFYSTIKIFNYKNPIIISVNNGFGKLKNVKAMIEAFQLIRKKIPTSHLHLVGSGFGKNEPADIWAKKKQLSEGIEFIGYQNHEKTISYINQSDLLIHPSLEESFGMTLVEAMSKKVPVIGGKKSGAVPWVLDDGKAGLLTDVRSPQAIADAAIAILKSSEKWQHFSITGYKHAKNNFSNSRVVDIYLEEYQKILRNG